MIRRQIRWNMTTDSGEQIRNRHRYIFAVINEPREIGRIRERILEQLSPADEFNAICDYVIPGTDGLHCGIFSFSSDRGKIEHPERIYKKPLFFRKDRDLVEETESELFHYLERLVA